MIFYHGSDGNGDRRDGNTAVVATDAAVVPR